MSVYLLEELSSAAPDALDRTRTVIILTVSPLEQHGPHLPLGVDAFSARHFTLRVRQRAVRDVLVDYGESLTRAGFRYILVANGHAGPGHLVALEEAAAIVSRRHGVTMASLSGHLVWEFLRGGYLPRIEAALGRPLPAARDPLAERLRPNDPLKHGGQGYVGHPALADPAFAKATLEVLLSEAMGLVDGLLAGRIRRTERRSPFFAIPFLRTRFWPWVGPAAGAAALVALAAWWARS